MGAYILLALDSSGESNVDQVEDMDSSHGLQILKVGARTRCRNKH